MTLDNGRRQQIEEAHRRTVRLLDNNVTVVGRWRKKLLDEVMLLNAYSQEHNALRILFGDEVDKNIVKLRKPDGTSVNAKDLKEMSRYTFIVDNCMEAARFANRLMREEVRA